MKEVIIKDTLDDLVKTMTEGMKKAMEEEPELSKTWAPEQIFEKGSNWCARHILITEKK